MRKLGLRQCPYAFAAALIFFASQPLNAESTFERENFGSFLVETERYQAEQYIMHAENSWVRTRLIWQSGDGRARVVVTDAGWIVELEVRILDANQNFICSYRRSPLGAVGQRPSNDAFWRWAIAEFSDFTAECAKLDYQHRDEFSREMELAIEDYPGAADAWKTAGMRVFGIDDRRCEQTGIRHIPVPVPSCVRWSGEQLENEDVGQVAQYCNVGDETLVFVSNLLIKWMNQSEEYDDDKARCAYEQLARFKGVNIRLSFETSAR